MVYQVIGVARSTDKALQMVEDAKPTLVLVDIFLKGNLTGIDLARELNKRSIPFIYISANSNKPVLEAAKSTQSLRIYRETFPGKRSAGYDGDCPLPV